ncbi:LysR family transcriptional regulator [Granulicella sp. WH15]|nr:LysR family transcriptional regulator [Granulicella sp. WH15]
MELRHLRYFVAVAEARSLKLAAEEKLHTTQPSLSRQIRDLENEVGAALFLRGTRGVELTAAGRVFLDHARVMLSQAETAVQSVRQIANPTKPYFSLGFMIGHDSTWLPKTLQILRDELPNIHVVISTQNSPQLAAALSQGLIDVAFLRREDGGPGLEYSLIIEEPFEVFLPKDHPLAAQSVIKAKEIVGETFLSVSGTALSVSGKPPALRLAIDRYLKERGLDIRPSHEVDNLGGVMSLIASTRGIALLPAYAKTFLPDSVTTRPLQGCSPTIDLSVGYRRVNSSATLKLLLSRVDELVAEVPNHA